MSPVPSRRAAVTASLTAVVITAVVVVVVVVALGGGRQVPEEQIGANVNLLFILRGLTAAQVDAQLKALRATGATLARADALWELSEPSPPVGGIHRYDWTFDDAVAGSLAANRLRWLPIVDYSAGWAQSLPGQDHSPPARQRHLRLLRLRRRARGALRPRRLVLARASGASGAARSGIRDLE